MSRRFRLAATLGATSLTISLTASLTIALLAPVAHADQRIDNADRASVISSYQQWLQPLLAVPTEWNGDLSACRAGQPSEQSQAAVLSAVNYMRALADLPPVRMSSELSGKSQEAALIMAANRDLSHQPPSSWLCWSKEGYDGANNGNLALGWGYGPGQLARTTGARAVVSYMEDPGPGNELVGHRRWLLFQALAEIGNGDTDTSNSIYTLGKSRRKAARSWVAWPTAGFFPAELEPAGRWSLTYPGADFSRAKVTVTTPEGEVPVDLAPVRNGYGDNTLSWDMRLPDAYLADPSADYPVTVKVTGIRLGRKKVTKEWTTTLVKAAAPTTDTP